jgi:hypothetical protein
MGRATGERLVEFGASTDLDFDFDFRGRATASTLQRRSDAARSGNVVCS